jgi:hypothetical protein
MPLYTLNFEKGVGWQPYTAPGNLPSRTLLPAMSLEMAKQYCQNDYMGYLTWIEISPLKWEAITVTSFVVEAHIA